VQGEHPHLDPGETYPVTTQLNFTRLSDPLTLVRRIHLTNAVSNPRSDPYSSLISQLRKRWSIVADYYLLEFVNATLLL
jgi:hypothetical protein